MPNTLMPVGIQEVEYYKKGGKVTKRKKTMKQKQKQSVVINIDNSRKTTQRKGKAQQHGPKYIPMPSINISQPSGGNGISTLLLNKLLDRLGEKNQVQEGQRLIQPQPNLNDIVNEQPIKEEKNEPDATAGTGAARPKEDEQERYIPVMDDDDFDEHITQAEAGRRLKEYFKQYRNLYNSNNTFKKGTSALLARQYGVELGGKYEEKELPRQIYFAIFRGD